MAVLVLLSLRADAAPRDIDGDGYVDVLVPLVSPDGPRPGGYGRVWATELWFHNGTSRGLAAIQWGCVTNSLDPCPIRFLAGRTTLVDFFLDSDVTYFTFTAGDASRVQLSARVFELSRNAQPNGVEVPVVSEDQWFTKPAIMIAVPQNLDSRVALRIYAPWMTTGSSVRVDLEKLDGEVIASTQIDMTQRGPFLTARRFTAINDLAVVFPQLGSHERFNIRVTPLTENMRFWAFATVTHRDTQHVLMVTPQLGE